MRNYTTAELDWEYQVEYLKYAQPMFPKAFSSRDDFQAQFDTASLVPVSDIIDRLSNCTGGMADLTSCRRAFGHRRDVQRIVDQFASGDYCPPIILKRGNTYRLMAGNTRISVGLTMHIEVLCKIIEVK